MMDKTLLFLVVPFLTCLVSARVHVTVDSMLPESPRAALVPGTEAWDLWMDPPVTLLKVTLFEVINPLEVILNGAKPFVRERGPYVYDKLRHKQDTLLSEDGTEVNYSEVKTLHFNQELSGDLRETDVVTMLNSALMGAVLTGDKDDSAATLSIINGAASSVFPEDPNPIFSTNTVKEWLFDGQRMKCSNIPPFNLNWMAFCIGLKSAHPENIRPEYDQNGIETGDLLFSYLHHINDSTDGVYTINTGLRNMQLLGETREWGEDLVTLNETLPFWSGPECNLIRGTDGTIFPPFLNPTSVLNFFSINICRSLYAVYQEDIIYQGVPGLRFTADDTQLGSVTDTPDNYCYCADNSACLEKGTIDLFSCGGFPMVATFPHFYQTSEKYLKMVDGLSPNQDKHQTFFDIAPDSGTQLRSNTRIQFNMLLKEVHAVDSTTSLPQALLPLLWLDEEIKMDLP